MRKNLPVTDKERTFSEDQKLISSTDLKGKIVHCNDAFVEVSGYSREELIGQPHNIVRHPDMPVEAYESMWKELKAGSPWMGLVKNRCKNGDYYWVSAYVTPVIEGGVAVGYESVRTAPSRDQIARAEVVYRGLNDGSWLRKQRTKKIRQQATLPVVLLLMILAGFQINGVNGAIEGAAFGAIGVLLFSIARLKRRLRDLSVQSSGFFNDPLAARVYHNRDDAAGQVAMALTSQNARLDTILTRIEDAAQAMSVKTAEGLSKSMSAHSQIEKQQGESQRITEAMREVSNAIETTTKNIHETAVNSVQVQTLVKSGTDLASSTHKAIEALNEITERVTETVRTIESETSRISAAAGVIEDIAEQTNLLALNAAIESARAGEQGRGFAVVADEVRTLAQKTQDTTSDIHRVINDLSVSVSTAVDMAAGGSESAAGGLSKVNEMEVMLKSISSAVDDIANVSDSMAESAKRQAVLTNEMTEQVGNVSELAKGSLSQSTEAASTMQDIGRLSTGLRDLVQRFR
ncbi:MAG: PAS domain-containing methyl-accepting chemotaxis protein [Pseudomonadota bacterium]|nr:PAS domain-containing methyl-accepting chemotaxis protein [Pseudomonadota bacterium]